MSQNINSKIKLEYYALKYLKFFFPFIGVLTFFIFLFYFIFQNSFSNSDDILVILAPFVIMIIFILLGFTLNKQGEKLLRINGLLNNYKPVIKYLHSTNILNFKGAVYLVNEDETGELKNGEFVVIEVSRNRKLHKSPVKVNYYFDTNFDEKLLIVDDGKNIFTGFKLEKAEAKQQLEKSIKIIPGLAAIGGITPGVVAIVLFFQIGELNKQINFYSSSLKWNNTQARILESNIVETPIKNNKRTSIGYNNVVKYIYSVNGTEYTSDIISLDYSPFFSYNDAAKLHNYFSNNKVINIKYNPLKPNQSYIIPPNLGYINNKKTTLIYVTVILFLIGVFLNIFLLFYIRKLKSKQLKLLNNM
jgi:hypothetical protein